MIDFKELTDEEFNRYAEQLCPSDNGNSLYNELKEDVEKKVTQIGSLSNQTDKLLECINKKDIEEIYKLCVKISKKLSRISKDFGMIPANYGIKNRNEYLRANVIEEKNVVFSYKNNVLHIKLPELLPHRPQFDTSTREMRYYYDIDAWRAGYLAAFQKEFINGKYRVYDNKVVLYFLHHVDRTKNVPDIDNLEIKVITDIITLFLLTDDDHKHVCHFMDMVEDDSSYTEIMIIPYKNFRT